MYAWFIYYFDLEEKNFRSIQQLSAYFGGDVHRNARNMTCDFLRF
jgi:hypothetical protein